MMGDVLVWVVRRTETIERQEYGDRRDGLLARDAHGWERGRHPLMVGKFDTIQKKRSHIVNFIMRAM
jgi:hypothetical protein